MKKSISKKDYSILSSLYRSAQILREVYHYQTDKLLEEADKILGLNPKTDEALWDCFMNDFRTLDQLLSKENVKIRKTPKKRVKK